MATKKIKKVTPRVPETVLVLRTCTKDMTSYNDFVWPKSGPVEAPDWSPEPRCGQGLHGLLWGQGEGSLLDWSPEANWLLVEVTKSDIVEIDQKVKFPRGNVIFTGSQLDATNLLQTKAPCGTVIVGATVTVGHNQTCTVGDYGTANAGDGGTANAGRCGTIQIKWWDQKAERYRTAVGYIGENGIEANVPYKCDGEGKFGKAY